MTLRYCAACGARLDERPPCTCGACGAGYWDNPRACGGAFVAHAGRLLLVRREREPWAGNWDVPGGFCDGVEHPEAAAVREVKEETGLDVTLTGLLGMWVDRYGDDDTPATLNVYYTAVADQPEAARADDETSEVRWFTPDELRTVPLAFPNHLRAAVTTWIEATTLPAVVAPADPGTSPS